MADLSVFKSAGPSLFGRTDLVLGRSLDGVALRQRVTANNIANANTPHFHRSRVPFEAALRQALDGLSDSPPLHRTHPAHLDGATADQPPAAAVLDSDTRMRNDGNNVDIEVEMAQLAKDELLYGALAQGLSNHYALLRRAIAEGRR